MLSAFHFLRPGWLLVLVPVVWTGWALWRRQEPREAWKRLIAPHLLDHLMVSGTTRERLRPLHALWAVWVIAVIALAGPTWRREPSPFAEDEAGLVILLKCTPSMMAADVAPTRLERAKHKLADVLELRESGASALIAYSGTAHVVMPLTRDGRIISVMAEGLEPSTMPVEGDALADALSLADTLITRAETSGSVLVLADAVSPGQEQSLTAYAAEHTVPVQFLSVGARVEPGLQRAAHLLDAGLTPMTVDSEDVETVLRKAKRDVQAVMQGAGGERWRDAGYWLLPILVFCAMWGGRKGWSV